METLKKIVSNQYFPAAAVLAAVVLFWAVGLLGGLSLLHNNQPPLTTLTWILFVYGAAVLTPLAGALAAVDLVRRWKRNRAAAAYAAEAGITEGAQAEEAGFAAEAAPAAQPVAVQDQPVQQQQRPAPGKPMQKNPVQKKSGSQKAA
ncbi:cytochrome c-type biogenesis protein CcmH [Pseudarthrobacter sp. R1]|uniref:cytochrome c-type biogenesis protein CcmH n=1 Tax=Pseudarthrobacter sp. R1 TaxID=2944934 RepID=UPI00210E8851|nr:cytochrome c-type biogenesis protein CcmH [Pseudarthrobacter sp. R1]MCQ6269230.1 cytochrome c-type biogenesis protein CcmH [Pseudarthrobacter sp. R1]